MTVPAFYTEWDSRAPGARRSVRRADLLRRELGLGAEASAPTEKEGTDEDRGAGGDTGARGKGGAAAADGNRKSPGNHMDGGDGGAGGAPGVPVLTVVGSKGKGTAATYASAYLAASGCRVVTVTSPALRTDRERIRVDGAAISAADLARLGERLAAAMASLPGPDRDGGYLSPSGLFLLAGVLHARTVGADALVLEAGMGGRSDEVSLFPPDVVAITEVFAEHVGVLGDTPAEIAADKAGVAAPSTSAVVSLPQSPPVTAAIAATVTARTGARVNVATVRPHHASSGYAGGGPPSGVPGTNRRPGGLGRDPLADSRCDRSPSGNPDEDLLPEDLTRRLAGTPEDLTGTPQGPAGTAESPAGMNAWVGCVAARRLLDVLDRAPASAERLASVLASVTLPGRSSSHPVPGSRTTVLVDAAIDRTGAAAALAAARRRWGRVDHVLACLPDHKDVDGVIAELDGLPVTYVRMPDHPHLRFTRTPPAGRPAVDAAGLTVEDLAALGGRIVALGTGYFTGRILNLVGADTERLFRP